jgi:polysaccharide biosynthesis/export protein
MFRCAQPTRLRVFRHHLLAVILVTACAPLAAAAPDGPAAYVVGPNDVLAITVFDQPQLTGKYVVQADGTLTFPLLGRLATNGLTMRQIEDEVRTRLASGGFLMQPQVGVSVDQYRSQQVFVMGEVRQPGSLQFTGSMDLIEALARAGAATERADGEAVIVRSKPGIVPDLAALERARSGADSDVIRVNLQKLQAGELSQNVALRSGDTLFVPRARSVFVSGQVKSAGEYVIRKGMTVRQVIAVAGGVTDRGSTRRIQIIRHVDDNTADVTIDASLQDLVQAGDTIVVRDRFF